MNPLTISVDSFLVKRKLEMQFDIFETILEKSDESAETRIMYGKYNYACFEQQRLSARPVNILDRINSEA